MRGDRLAELIERVDRIDEKLDLILARLPTVENLLRVLDRQRREPTRRGEHPMWTDK